MTLITENERYKALQKIIEDKVHGSSQILLNISNHFLKYKTDQQYLLLASKLIRKRLLHFTGIINFVDTVEFHLRKNQKEKLFNYLSNFAFSKATIYREIYEKHSKIFKKYNVILTISHSKTLVEVFREWKNKAKNIKVIVCESRPDFEGVLMAKTLKNSSIKTEVITEALAGKIISKIDAVFLGADQILLDGSIINKTGSRMLAILAKHHKIPVYVIAARNKFCKSGKSKAVPVIKNDNFETIEKNLITKILSD